VVSCGVKPWFDVFVGTKAGAGKDAGGGGGCGEAKLGIPMTKKKVCRARVELQNVETPETNLVVIQRAVDLVGFLFLRRRHPTNTLKRPNR